MTMTTTTSSASYLTIHPEGAEHEDHINLVEAFKMTTNFVQNAKPKTAASKSRVQWDYINLLKGRNKKIGPNVTEETTGKPSK